MEKARQLLNQEMQKRLSAKPRQANQAQAPSIITIPVVFHIVLPDPTIVTDAEVDYQMAVLNRDFAGVNDDSTNLSPMFPYSLRGHSSIRFCLAQKDTRGNNTTGIERRCSSTLTTTSKDDPVKLSAPGGLDAWDPSQYLNVWICNATISGLLGYATYPFPFSGYPVPEAAFQGVVITRAGFGNIRSPYALNRGRTLVHETGHYFGLLHSFEGGCNSTDFSQSSFGGSGNDDTPSQSNATGSGNPSVFTCPSGLVPSGCLPSVESGRLYQNYMDYTDDPCLSMFTVNQVVRMEAAIDLFRASLKNTDACSQPVVLTNNIAPWQVNNPTGGRGGVYTGCSSAANTHTYCSSSAEYIFTPQITLRNTGSNLVREVEIWISIDNSPAQLNKKAGFAAGIPFLTDTTIALNPITCNGGAHVLKFFTKNPNGIADSKPENDTIIADIFVDLPSITPIMEGFEQPVFPPAGWESLNTSGDEVTWNRTDSVQKSGIAAAYINLYGYNKTGGYDNLVTPNIDVRNADSIIVSFERAYRQYSLTNSDFTDTLELVISSDCKKTFTSIWKKGGARLATNSIPTGSVNWFPAETDWLKETFDIKPYITSGTTSLHVGFRTRNGYGQNLFLDDVNINLIARPRRDAAITRVDQPTERLCSRTTRPTLVISNSGKDTLRSIKINYAIDGGPTTTQTWTGLLPGGQTATVSLAGFTVSTTGAHRFSVYTSEPNQSADENTLNDTVNIRFSVVDPVSAPVNEGFETTVFPPVYWDLAGPAALSGWKRTIRAFSLGSASAWLPNFRYNGNGAKAELYSPLIQVTNADSVFVKFDLSYRTLKFAGNLGISTDTLEVLFTSDCGLTTRSIYKKWGNELQTVKEPYPYSARDITGFIPTLLSEWRTDSINLTSLAAPSSQFQLVFRNINNNGNNLFLDNIRVNQVIVPARLKSQGYLILPNPSTGLFYLRHFVVPVNLKAVQVVNANGQLIWMKSFKADALSLIPLDLSGQAAGVYFVRLTYTDKSITQRIVKIK